MLTLDRGIHDFSLQALSYISVPHYFLVIVYEGVDRGDKLQELLLLLYTRNLGLELRGSGSAARQSPLGDVTHPLTKHTIIIIIFNNFRKVALII